MHQRWPVYLSLIVSKLIYFYRYVSNICFIPHPLTYTYIN